MPYKDPEKQRAYLKAWQVAHPQEMSAYRLTYEQSHGSREITPQRRLQRSKQRKHRLAIDPRYRKQRQRGMRVYWRKHPLQRKANRRRYRALKNGATINDFTAAQWQEMQAAYDHRCAYCGKRAKGHLTQDHITPLSKGGSNTAANIVPACRSCNSRKYDGPPLCPVQPLLLTLAPAVAARKARDKVARGEEAA